MQINTVFYHQRFYRQRIKAIKGMRRIYLKFFTFPRIVFFSMLAAVLFSVLSTITLGMFFAAWLIFFSVMILIGIIIEGDDVWWFP